MYFPTRFKLQFLLRTTFVDMQPNNIWSCAILEVWAPTFIIYISGCETELLLVPESFVAQKYSIRIKDYPESAYFVYVCTYHALSHHLVMFYVYIVKYICYKPYSVYIGDKFNNLLQ